MDKLLLTIKRYIPKKVFTLLWPLYHFFLGVAANIIYRWPSEKLIVIGVTGTTGKTTSTYLIAKMLQGAGYKVGYTSTAMFGDGEKEWLNNKKMTMVGRLFTHQMLRTMVKNGCHYAVIETSSEGIIQYRHRFINYDIILFTCLYPEHIEAHGNFENYKEAKGMLFAHLKNGKTKYADDTLRIRKPKSGLQKTELMRIKKTIIVNGSDEHASYFLDFWAEEKWAFRIAEVGKVKPTYNSDVKEIVASTSKTNGQSFLMFGNSKVAINLLGDFNRQNMLAAISVGLAQSLPLEKLKIGVEKISGVAGRLERINCGQPFTVIVDYAFEPQAVSKLYETVVGFPHERIIHVLGSAGGGRDKSRRPILGELAGRRSDIMIVTDEDPYDEDPATIIAEVAAGADTTSKRLNVDLFTFLDRRQAIHTALSQAQPGDIVLITGKGSEQAICRARGLKEPWDDRNVSREELHSLGYQSVDK
jgi:UDP-N-acetylmuramoyl-L-alanyl-D-glutamate--2,6-diaminopimelate ligase